MPEPETVTNWAKLARDAARVRRRGEGQGRDTLTFFEAVKRGLLVDYKVIVLAVEEAHVRRRIQDLLEVADNSLRLDDASKIIGCWGALAKQASRRT